MIDDLPTLLKSAGFHLRTGANASSLDRLESLLELRLPAEFSQLYSLSDGADSHGLQLYPVSEIEGYADVFEGGLGYVPFTDSNDSNPYSICCNDPMRGMIVHVFHDDESPLICRGLGRFFDLIIEARQRGTDVGFIEGDFAFDRRERTADDVITARELMKFAGPLDKLDEWRTQALIFAAQLFGPGQESELANALALGNEYVRGAVIRRWQGLGTTAALERLREDSAAFQNFVSGIKNQLEASGLATEPYRDGTFLIQPGRIGLNFKSLFAEFREPSLTGEWIHQFVERLTKE